MRPGTDFSRNEIEAFDKGYRINKDGVNVAKNIRNRVLVTVLRESLLKQLDNGAFKPKKLKGEGGIIIVSENLAKECKE